MSLLTAPFINRVLGVYNIGLFSYAQSILNMFLVFSGLGLSMLAAREIAKNRDNKEKVKIIFSSILIASIIASTIVFIPYILFALFFTPFANVRTLMLLFVVSLFLNALNTEWLFTGLEKFGYIAIRSVILRSLSLIALFVFVRNETDLIIYAIIMIIGLCGLHLLNIIKGVQIAGFSFKSVRPLYFVLLAKIFYLHAIIVSLYHTFDRLILGSFSTDELALYSVARNISLIAITIITVIPLTIAPRAAFLYSENKDDYKNLVKKSFGFTMYALIPACLGIFILSSSLIAFMGGEQFYRAVIPLRILALLPLLMCTAMFVNTNIAVPAGKERNTLISNFAVAGISLSINFAFARSFGANAASIAVVTGEIVGLTIMICLAVKQRIFPNIFSINILKFVISGLIMTGALYFIVPFIDLGDIFNIFVLAIIGVMIYFASNMLLSLVFRRDDEAMIIIKQFIRKYKRSPVPIADGVTADEVVISKIEQHDVATEEIPKEDEDNEFCEDGD